LIVERDHPTLGRLKVVNSGLNFSRTPADIYGLPPFLGEHNHDVLSGLLGLADADIEKLTQSGILYRDPRSDAGKSP
jgi:crotonobetainyl-CoA:carnitine CoA-transferase CaiB-like acyl-CoA transferase